MLAMLLVVAGLTVGAEATPAETRLYVSTFGNDQNPGTDEQPFLTVHRARDEVRKLIADGLKMDVVVLLRDGVYELAEPLKLGPEDSGNERFSITYAAYPGEAPILSGGRRINGWKRGKDGVWTVDLPSARGGAWTFRQLFQDGQRRQRARTPNTGFLRVDGLASLRAPFRFQYRNDDVMPEWAKESDVELIALIAWADVRMPLREVDAKKRTITLGGGRNAACQENNARYYIENAPDGLDADGEWKLDARSGSLSYRPVQGEVMNRAETVAPALRELVRIEGEPLALRLVRNVRFRGLTFHHTEWPIEPEGYTAVHGAAGIGGALTAVGAVDCAIEKCVFAHLGGYAIELGKGCARNRVVGNDIHDLGAGGIKVGEIFQRPNEEEKTSENILSDNHIHHGGLLFPSAAGIWVGESSQNIIAHNEINDLFHSGISLGWTRGYGANQCRGNSVEANLIHDLGKNLLSDMGGIRTVGAQPGTAIRNNVIHDVLSSTYGGWGINADEGSSDIHIEGNLVYGCRSASFHHFSGKDNVVRNNIFALATENQIMRTMAESHRSFVFENNIVVWSEGNLLGNAWGDDGYAFDRNIYWKTDGSNPRFATWTFEEWQRRGMDAGSIVADPLFADAAKYDFTVSPDSRALKMGFKPLELSDVGPRPQFRRTQEVAAVPAPR